MSEEPREDRVWVGCRYLPGRGEHGYPAWRVTASHVRDSVVDTLPRMEDVLHPQEAAILMWVGPDDRRVVVEWQAPASWGDPRGLSHWVEREAELVYRVVSAVDYVRARTADLAVRLADADEDGIDIPEREIGGEG